MRSIVQTNNPALRAIAKEIPIKDIGSARVRALIADMKALLAKEELGVALAAPQVGESVRLFIVASKDLIVRKRSEKKPEYEQEFDAEYLEGLPEGEPAVYINPIMVKMSRKKIDKHEGCLSVRGKWGMVPRAEKVTVRAYNENGAKFERGASGFLAHIFQHEMDHLEGILYIDTATEVYDAEKDE